MRTLTRFTLASVAAVVALAFVALYDAWSATHTVDELTNLGRVKVATSEIRLHMIGMSNGMRGYLLDTSSTHALEEKNAEDEAFVAAVNRVLASTADPELRKLAEAIGALDDAELDPMENRVLDVAAHDGAAARRIYFEEYLPLRERQWAIVDALDRAASTASDASVAEAKADTRRLALISAGTAAAVVALLIWSAWMATSMTRRLAAVTATLRDTAGSVLLTAHEVSRSSQSLSEGATEQAASIEETSASMEEMSSMTRKNADSARDVARLMSDVDSRVAASTHSLTDMVASMNAIQSASQEVARIIKTIDDIAFQTNILSLNAAVEAARAGGAGAGFAVVADEVRTLAQRSAAAARETSALIENSMAKTVFGASTVGQVADAIRNVTDSVATVQRLVVDVREASQQQSQGIEQVCQAVTQMETVTQATAATAEEAASSGDALATRAQQLTELVGQLQHIVGRTGPTSAQPVRDIPSVPRLHSADATTRRSPWNRVSTNTLAFGEEETRTTGTFG